ncbi:FMN-binding protein [Natranaerofaba carboxydovora]|uniref:FMN-binding protein n=1 Tax=Natranaerofaba carboxydovora TaxID=2742683 RepID=UPI001F1389FA|nr:FMN-binding protein [Natranaerofaba carboxydovora]UMZ72847.1 Electron transport complex subunit RnfG [Natranaerofaba carboxydovora]
MSFGEILKLGITLMVVAIVSAGVLTFAHGVTAPVIEEQQLAEIEDAMFEFFPDADEVKIEEIDGEEYYIALADGEEVGVATRSVGGGYGGDIKMMVAVDMDGTIKGVQILAHEETAGLGDVIEKEDFREEFVGIDKETAVSAEVDNISGATASVGGATTGAERGRDQLAFEYLGFEAPETDVDVTQVPDGTYEGTGDGFGGDTVVEVTVEGGEIVEIEEISNEDTPEYWDDAWPEIADRIIEAQSMEVDAVSGATASSEGVMEAVVNALIDETE